MRANGYFTQPKRAENNRDEARRKESQPSISLKEVKGKSKLDQATEATMGDQKKHNVWEGNREIALYGPRSGFARGDGELQ